jgi:hypothetical protein
MFYFLLMGFFLHRCLVVVFSFFLFTFKIFFIFFFTSHSHSYPAHCSLLLIIHRHHLTSQRFLSDFLFFFGCCKDQQYVSSSLSYKNISSNLSKRFLFKFLFNINYQKKKLRFFFYLKYRFLCKTPTNEKKTPTKKKHVPHIA